MTFESDAVVCRCLHVRESRIVDCIAVTGAETVREVSQHTGAGAGCRSCHCRIAELIGCRMAERATVVAVRRA